MHTVEFDANVIDGRIDIPEQYRNDFLSTVRVVLLKTGDMIHSLPKQQESWDAKDFDDAMEDPGFIERMASCSNDFEVVDSEVLGEW